MYDLIIGFVTFIFILGVVSMVWFKMSARIQQDTEMDIRLKIARDVSNILVRTEGNPPRWDRTPIDSCLKANCTLGLSTEANVISLDKINALIALDNSYLPGYPTGHDQIRESFKLGYYDFQIKVKDKNNRNLTPSIGKDPMGNLSAAIERRVFINNSDAIFEFSIYKGS